MKKILVLMLTVVMLCCAFAALAEVENTSNIETAVEDGGFVIRVHADGDMGWLADDMAQDDSILKLSSADMVDGDYVARYDVVGDGDMAVSLRHYYTGFACDEVYGWDVHVEDGEVTEVTGGFYRAISDDADLDPVLVGEWLEKDTQYTAMTVEKNPERGWDVEIAAPLTHGAYVFKTTIYQDCDTDSLVYDKGKFWEVPIEDSENTDLGEATVAGTSGSISIGGAEENVELTWYDEHASVDNMVTFVRAE